MRERAALAGGTLDIETPPGGGTRIRLRVPITPHESRTVNRESPLTTPNLSTANHEPPIAHD